MKVKEEGKNNFISKNTGVTIVALIITVILIIILIGVSAKILENRGIISKTQTTSEGFEREKAQEKLSLYLQNLKIKCVEKKIRNGEEKLQQLKTINGKDGIEVKLNDDKVDIYNNEETNNKCAKIIVDNNYDFFINENLNIDSRQDIDNIEQPEDEENSPVGTAKYTIQYYKQNVQQDGYEMEETETQYYTIGKQVTASNSKEYAGFIYNASDSINMGKVKDDGSLILRLYYDRKTYTATFNGGTPETITKVYEAPLGELPTITKTGYTFIGWEDTNHNIITEETTMPLNGATYTANWRANTYTVEYNGNGATSGETLSSTHTYDEAKTLTTNGYIKTGYTFANWNTKADGTGTSYNNEESVTNLIAENGATVTLYAQWKANTYTVVYDKNAEDATGTTASSTHTYDKEQTLTPNGFIKTEHIFKGWNTKADGTGDSYTNQQSVKNLATSGIVTLYAQWVHAEVEINSNLYETIEEAIEKANNLDTIKALKTIERTSTSGNTTTINIPTGKTITLDLNGKKITNDTNATITNYGELTIKDTTTGGTIECTANNNIAVLNRASIKVESGTITAASYGIKNKIGTLNITGGTINGWNAIENAAQITMSGGSITAGKYGINNIAGAEATITGGEITAASQGIENAGTLTLGTEGGTPNQEAPSIKSTSGMTAGINNTNTFNFYDGKITGTPAISGNVTAKQEGYNITKTVIGSPETVVLSNTAEASIEEVYYAKIEYAIEAITTGTIKVENKISRIAESINIPNGKDITLNLNGKEISGEESATIRNKATLTITDETEEKTGTIKCSNEIAIWNIEGKTTIINGNIESTNQITIKNNAQLEIKGGAIKVDTYNIAINNEKTLEMSGGSITAGKYGINNVSGAEATITGGGITAEFQAIMNAGTITIGTKDNETALETPTIKSNRTDVPTIETTGTFNFYDGKVIGATPITGEVSDKPENKEVIQTIEAETNVKQIGYIVTYNANGGTEVTTTQQAVDGKSVTIIATIPTKTGYTFAGWSTNSSATTAEYNSNQAYAINKNVTLYAVWTANNYTLTIDPDGAKLTYYSSGVKTSTSAVTRTFTYGTPYQFASTYAYVGAENGYMHIANELDKNGKYAPKKDGYIFDGWKITLGSGNVSEQDDRGTHYKYIYDGSNPGDVTIKAQWKLPEAQIGAIKYATLEEAIAACTSNATPITLCKKIERTKTIEIPLGKNITLDLKGQTIEANGAVAVINNGTLTIKDSISSGKITSTTSVIDNYGTLAVENGTITAGNWYGIYNVGRLTLGNNDTTVSTTVPAITGIVNGVNNNNGTFNFYDGKITGNTAISGTVASKPDTYVVSIDIENGKEIATLQPEGTPEAQITNTGKMYTTIESAMAACTDSSVTYEAKLLKDINRGSSTAYFDLRSFDALNTNGFTITGYIDVNNGMTINGNGTETTAISGKIRFWDGNTLNNVKIDGNVYSEAQGLTIYNSTISEGIQQDADYAYMRIENSTVSGTVGVYNGSENANVEIINSNISGTEMGIKNQSSNGTVTINGGTVESSNGDAINNLSGGNLTVSGENTRIISQNDSTKTAIVNNATLTINNGTITAAGYGIYNYGSGNVEVIEGKVQSTSHEAIYNNGIGTVTIAGGELTSVTHVISNMGTGEVNVTKGSLTSQEALAIYNQQATGRVTVIGGTLKSNAMQAIGMNAGTLTIGNSEDAVSTTTPEIVGRTYGIYMLNGTFNFYDGKITGNTAISGTVASKPENYEVSIDIENGQEVATLQETGMSEAQITSTGKIYTTIESAIAACPDNTQTEIEVLKTIERTSAIEIPSGKNIKLDLKGQTITNNTNATITNRGILTVIDETGVNGTIESIGNIGILNKNTLTIQSGIITSTDRAIKNEKGTLFIEGGKIQGYNGIQNAATMTMSNGSIDVEKYGIYNVAGATATITNQATIKAKDQGISNEGTLTLGTSGGIPTTTPTIESSEGKAGVENYATFYYYDGTITGTPAIQGSVTGKENGYQVTKTVVGKKETVKLFNSPEASIGTAYYETIEKAMEAITIGTIKIEKTITRSDIYIDDQKDITINTNGYTINSTIHNKGKLTITGTGTIQSQSSFAIWNTGKTVTIQNGKIISADRAIKNDTGDLYINGGTIQGSNAIENVAKITMLAGNIIAGKYGIDNSGTVKITGGRITATSQGVYNTGTGKLTLGSNDGTLKQTPTIESTGGKPGIQNYGTVYFYDGTIKGKPEAISEEGKTYIPATPSGCKRVRTFDSNKVETEILSTTAEAQCLNKYYGTIESAIIAAPTNTQTEITVLTAITNTNSTINIPSEKNIIINTNGKVISNTTNTIQNKGTLTITGTGTILSSKDVAIWSEYGTTTIKSGTIQANSERAIKNTAILNIEGGTIKSSTTTAIQNEKTLTISAGTIEAGKYGINNISGATATITGGSITGTSQGIYNVGTLTLGTSGGTPATTPTITSNGGKAGVQNGGTFNFYDGTIKGKVAIQGTVTATEAGYEVSTTTTNGIEIATLKLASQFEAQVGSTKYKTLQEAINACSTISSTVIVLKDIENTSIVSVLANQNIQLNLNGKTITNSTNNVIQNSGTLTITGNGSINSTNSSNNAVNNTATGILTIENGTLSTTGSNKHAIYNVGQVLIKDVTINATGYSLQNAGSGELTINGGTINREIYNSATLKINGGTMQGIYIPTTAAKTVITGGILNATVYNYGTLTLGVNDNNVSITTPAITGGTYGIRNYGTLNFYDGIVKGQTAISGSVTNTAIGYKVSTTTSGTTQTAKLVTDDNILDVYVYSYQEMQNYINNNDTVILNVDDPIEMTYNGTYHTLVIPEGKKVIIDMRDYELYNINDPDYDSDADDYIIYNKGTLILQGKGTITNNSPECDIAIMNEGNLTIGAGIYVDGYEDCNGGTTIIDGEVMLNG